MKDNPRAVALLAIAADVSTRRLVDVATISDESAVVVLEWWTHESSCREEFDNLEDAAGSIVRNNLGSSFECSIAVRLDGLADSRLGPLVAKKIAERDIKAAAARRAHAIAVKRNSLAKERERLAMLENHQALTALSTSAVAKLEADIVALEAEDPECPG